MARNTRDITVNWMGFPVLLKNVKTKFFLGQECVDIDPSLVEGRVYRFLLSLPVDKVGKNKVWSTKEAYFVRHHKLMTKDEFAPFLTQIGVRVDEELGDREI